MIDNFAPQGYPLEVSTDGGNTWELVIGWTRLPDEMLAPIAAPADDTHATITDLRNLRYRLASPRASSGPVIAPTAAPPRRAPRT